MRNSIRPYRDIGIASGHLALNRDRATYRVNDTRELNQHAIAGVLHDPATVLLGLRIDYLAEERPETFVRKEIRAASILLRRRSGGSTVAMAPQGPGSCGC